MIQLGRITTVSIEEDTRDVFVNVSMSGSTESRRMQFLTPASGMWVIPREGEIVEVAEAEREFVARFPSSPAPVPMPEGLSQGDFSFRFDEDTELRFQQTEEGVIDVTVKASGELRLIDNAGYGIVGHGDGDFTWFHESIEFDPENKAEIPQSVVNEE